MIIFRQRGGSTLRIFIPEKNHKISCRFGLVCLLFRSEEELIEDTVEHDSQKTVDKTLKFLGGEC